MYNIHRCLVVKLFITLTTLEGIRCTIDGAFFPIKRRLNTTKAGVDPCNPLYWYPRHIPEYCYYQKDITTESPFEDPRPIPMPIPVPIPPIPVPMPMPVPPPILPPILPPPMMPLPYPLPFGIPLAPTNPMLPVAGMPLPPRQMFSSQSGYLPRAPPNLPPHLTSPFASYIPPYGIQRRPMSMVPGIPGLVAPDGGINILPFSDAYADMLEKHKQKMIRKRLEKLLDDFANATLKPETKNIIMSGNDITDED